VGYGKIGRGERVIWCNGTEATYSKNLHRPKTRKWGRKTGTKKGYKKKSGPINKGTEGTKTFAAPKSHY